MRILLAEDNPVNQRLASLLLEKQGFTVVAADNGRYALAALERQSFDVVLMDLEMPEMNGQEAAALIRHRELGTGRRVPIIALTAHAIGDELEAPFEGGMDAAVSKPIQTRELLETIRRLVPAFIPPRAEATPQPVSRVIDAATVLVHVSGDMQFLRNFVELFCKNSSQLLGEIGAAIAAKDAARLRQAAHKLTGSVSLFGASAAFDAALKLQALGRRGDFHGAEPAFRDLGEAIQGLRQALTGLVPTPASP